MADKPSPYLLIDNVYILLHTDRQTRYLVLVTEVFDEWLESLPPKTRLVVLARLDRLSVGHFGDHKRFDGLLELRWLNGMRVYGFFHENRVVIALNGGNKNAQDKDIRQAKKIREEVLAGARPVSKPGAQGPEAGQ